MHSNTAGRLRLTVAAVVVASVITGCLGSMRGSGPSLNDEVRDGHFAFTVTAINLGVPETGYRTAQGVFVVVHLMVKNLGEVVRSVYCQNQTLKDSAGRKYENAVSVGANQIDIEPGSQVHVTCAFDVPTGTLPSTIELHSSQFSHGVTVTLLGRR